MATFGDLGQTDAAKSSGTVSRNVDAAHETDSSRIVPLRGKPPIPLSSQSLGDKSISCISCRKRKLKCDRNKPGCSTCIRLRHVCEYPERKRNTGGKRRNMKELEARLAQVEGRLVSESTANPAAQDDIMPTLDTDWGLGMDLNMDLDLGDDGSLDPSFEISPNEYGFQASTQMAVEDFSQELIALGLQEPLPAQGMIDDLYQIFFNKFHPTLPMIHKLRFFASLDRAPHMRPPICLRYAIWTMAASISEKYSEFEDVLYERARRYIQDAEMQGHGEAFVSVYHAQTWVIIAIFEASKTYFSRSWMSTGRASRMIHMLGLHRLDGDSSESKHILPPARDWIELEERRRTFWGAYYGDRWASSGSGWPMIINEKEIMTNLPSNETAFENGFAQKTVTLQEALTPEGASQISSFGGVILSATLFGHNFQHLHQTGSHESPEDLVNGEYWKRHRKMDNVLSNTFMFLPDHLRLPSGLEDMNVAFLHMNIHASTICLHRAAVITAEKHQLDPAFICQCKARGLMAADAITSIMRSISHIDPSNMNSWMGFCLYVAGGALIQDRKSSTGLPSSITNLEFLVVAMRAIGKRHSITRHFSAQMELDMEVAGITNLCKLPAQIATHQNVTFPRSKIPSPRRPEIPFIADNFQPFAKSDKSLGLCEVFPRSRGKSQAQSFQATGVKAFTSEAPASTLVDSSQSSPEERIPRVNWEGNSADSQGLPQVPNDELPWMAGAASGAATAFPSDFGISQGHGDTPFFSNTGQSIDCHASAIPERGPASPKNLQHRSRLPDDSQPDGLNLMSSATTFNTPAEWKPQDASARFISPLQAKHDFRPVFGGSDTEREPWERLSAYG